MGNPTRGYEALLSQGRSDGEKYPDTPIQRTVKWILAGLCGDSENQE